MERVCGNNEIYSDEKINYLSKKRALNNAIERLADLRLIGELDLDARLKIEIDERKIKKMLFDSKNVSRLDQDVLFPIALSEHHTQIMYYKFPNPHIPQYEFFFIVIIQDVSDDLVAWMSVVATNNWESYSRCKNFENSEKIRDILLEFGAVPVLKKGRFFKKSSCWPLCFSTRCKFRIKDRPSFTYVIQNRAKMIRLFLNWTDVIINQNCFDEFVVTQLLEMFKDISKDKKPKKVRVFKKIKLKPTVDESKYFEILKLFDLSISGLPLVKHEKHVMMCLFYCFEHRKTHEVNLQWVTDLQEIVQNHYQRQGIYKMPKEIWTIVSNILEPSAMKRSFHSGIKWLTEISCLNSDLNDPTYGDFFKNEFSFFVETISCLKEVFRIVSNIDNKEHGLIHTFSKHWDRSAFEVRGKFKIIEALLNRIIYMAPSVVYTIMMMVTFDPCYEFFKNYFRQTLSVDRNVANFYDLSNPGCGIIFFIQFLKLMALKALPHNYKDKNINFYLDMRSNEKKNTAALVAVLPLLKSSVAVPRSKRSVDYINDILVGINVLTELRKIRQHKQPSDFTKETYDDIRQIYLNNKEIFKI